MVNRLVSAEIIQRLDEIANIKWLLPPSARVFANELGLYVQMREASGMAILKAGGRFRSRIELRRGSYSEPWRVKKYRPGDWVGLVEPTQRLVHWLAVRGAVLRAVKDDFEYAIRTFHSTGELELPERIDSIPDDSILGRHMEPYSDVHGPWDHVKGLGAESELLRYLEVNPGHAPAWQALMRTCIQLGRYPQSIAAINRAISIAPYEAEFHREAALVYITALKNASEPNLQMGILGPAQTHCTLEALQCSHEEARVSCIRHLTMVLESKRPDSGHYKRESLWLLEWCAANSTFSLFDREA